MMHFTEGMAMADKDEKSKDEGIFCIPSQVQRAMN